MNRKVIILTEEEPFFYPNFFAKLAEEDLIKCVIIYQPGISLKRRFKGLKKKLIAYGVLNSILFFWCLVVAKTLNLLTRDLFYSVSKVVKTYKLKYYRIKKLHSKEFMDIIEKEKCDLVLAEVSTKIKKNLLDKVTFLNRHCSLLPSYAGVLPVFWALTNDEKQLGVTIHIMDENYDSGPVVARRTIPEERYSFFGAYHRMFDVSVEMVKEILGASEFTQISVADCKSSYYSWPDKSDRKEFLRKGNKFGSPFRFH